MTVLTDIKQSSENVAGIATGFTGARQTTIKSEIVLTGTGVHSGALVSLVLHPADADTGFRFSLTKDDGSACEIMADYRSVCDVTLCTVLGNGNGMTISTVEHLLAALRGLSVDNVGIEIDSREVPIMDGSSAAFVDALDEVGICELDAPRRFIKILKPVTVCEGDSWATLSPYNGFHLDVHISFDNPIIGTQKYAVDMNPGVFRRELSRARTFGFMKDVEQLWASGHALGASLENTVAIGEDKIINPEGLRFADEFVRHKILDAVGDLALAGAPLLGSFRSYRSGHKLNSMVLRKLFSDGSAWVEIEAPRSRETAQHVDLGGFVATNYAASRS